jgi:hypothetical protein
MRGKHSFVVIPAPTLGLYDDSGFGPSVTALERNRLSETANGCPIHRMLTSGNDVENGSRPSGSQASR